MDTFNLLDPTDVQDKLNDISISKERTDTPEITQNKVRDPKVDFTFHNVQIPIEEARLFFISPLQDTLQKYLEFSIEKTDQILDHLHQHIEREFSAALDGSPMPPAKSSQVSLRSQLIELLGSVAKSLGSLITSTAVIIEQARTTGIKEGINGYRSLLQVALRVLEKVASAVQSYPFPSASNTSKLNGLSFLSSSLFGAAQLDPPPETRQSIVKKWVMTYEVFFKQLKVLDLMLATASNMTLCSDDLLQISTATVKNERQKQEIFKEIDGNRPRSISQSMEQQIEQDLQEQQNCNRKISPEEVEREIVKLSEGMPNEVSSFFGSQFGIQYQSNIQRILRGIVLASASYNAASDNTHHLLIKAPLSIAYGAYYGLFPEQAAEKFVSGKQKGNVADLKSFWNLTELEIAEKASSFILPNMAIDIKLSLPTVRIELTRDDGTKTFVSPPSLPPMLMLKQNQTEPLINVKCRLISYKEHTVTIPPEAIIEETNFFSKLSETFKLEKTKENDLSNTLIIHFHGGGFIAQGVSSHLSYLKYWSKDTGAPIFSVDYSLAPEYPYPVAFQECYYAYAWACTHAKELGSTGEKIIVVGDSAGGNLACAVVNMAVTDRVRIPDAIILAYPCLYMHMVVSPSRILSVIDPLLPLETLRAIFHAYIPEDTILNTLENPFLSPGAVSDDILRNFPSKIFIAVGTLDPLLDDAVYFAKRLCMINKPVCLKVFDNFPHGWLNLANIPALGKEMADAVKIMSDWMVSVSKE